MAEKSEDDLEREMATRRQKDTVRSLLGEGDGLFVAARFVESSTKLNEVADVLRRIDARSAPDLRWKNATLNEVKRKVANLMELLPKKEQKAALDMINERRRAEAEEAASLLADDADPEYALKQSRKKLRDQCGRIKRQLIMVEEARASVAVAAAAHEESARASDDDASLEGALIPTPVEEAAPISPSQRVALLASDLAADLSRRRPVAQAPRYRFDGARGLQLIAADRDWGNEAGSSDGGDAELETAATAKLGAKAEDYILVGPIDLAALRAAPEDRLADRVGAPFVPSAVAMGAEGERVVAALEAALLDELTLKHAPRGRAHGPYTASGAGAYEGDAGDEAALPFGMALRPMVGRHLRTKLLGLHPESTLRARGEPTKVLREVVEGRARRVVFAAQAARATSLVSGLRAESSHLADREWFGPSHHAAAVEALLALRPATPQTPGRTAALPPPVVRSPPPVRFAASEEDAASHSQATSQSLQWRLKKSPPLLGQGETAPMASQRPSKANHGQAVAPGRRLTEWPSV
jgi:hypothetical protein